MSLLERSEAAPGSRADAGPDEFLSDYGIRSLSALSPGPPYIFYVGQPGVPGRLPAGGVRLRHVRRQLELARARSGRRSTRCLFARCYRCTRSMATTSASNARRARASSMTLYEVAQDLPTAWRPFSCATAGPPPGLRRDAEVPGGSALAGPHPVLRVLPRRQRRGPGRQPPDGLDRADSGADAPFHDDHPREVLPRSARCHFCDERAREAPGPRARPDEPARCAPIALPDQHPHPSRRSGRGARARRPRSTTSRRLPRRDRRRAASTGSGSWGLADRPGGPPSRARTRSCAGEFRTDAARPARRGHLRLAFAIQAYDVAPRLRRRGGARPRLRERLAARGLKLLLDFVPNHVAPDHPWVKATPSTSLHGTRGGSRARAAELPPRARPAQGPAILAYGRDPYFHGWPDTLQLNYRHAGLREAR